MTPRAPRSGFVWRSHGDRGNEGITYPVRRYRPWPCVGFRWRRDFCRRAGADLEVICGKVGGYARYSDAFGPLAGRLHAIIEEGAKRSAYSFPGLGTIAFVRDADENHLLVSMASLVGKWIRELMMARIVRHYGHADSALAASGYHDPVTDRFVLATALVDDFI